MKINSQMNRPNNKIKPFQANQTLTKLTFKPILNETPSISNTLLSFDKFLYRDHVTLKNYNFSELKQNEVLQRQITQKSVKSISKSNFDNQGKKINEQSEIWKKIKQNRNKFLVNGNWKKTQQVCLTQKEIQNRERVSMVDIVESQLFGFQVYKSKTTDNPLIGDNFSVTHSYRSSSEQKPKIYQKSSPFLSDQYLRMVKIKRKINSQIDKISKKLFRDYLLQQSNQLLNFKVLAADPQKFSSKVQKLQKLIKIIQKKNQNNQTLTNQSSKLYFKTSIDKYQSQHFNNFFNETQRNNDFKSRLKTKIQTQNKFLSVKRQISNQKIRKIYPKDSLKRNQNLKLRRNYNVHSSEKYQTKNYHTRKQQLSNDIQNRFRNQWQKIDKQIKIKFRREVAHSLSPNKIKQIFSKTQNLNL